MLQSDESLNNALEKCLLPPDEAFCLPPECYSQESILKQEMEAIFRKLWIGIGHAGRFKQAGDYETMEIGGIPIIVLRDKTGQLRCYANSCRHRGARLLSGEGNCSGIRCPFHSWAYKLDGSLAGVPHIEDMKNFDRENYGLIEFRADEKCGFAFVCLNENGPNLSDQLGNFEQLHSPWPLNSLIPTRRRTFEVACNWKAFIDVFNEYYHLPYVHPDSIDAVYDLPDSPDKVTGAFASQYGTTQGTGGLLEDQQDDALPLMPGIDASVENGVRYSWVFPNMTFAVGRDALWIYESNPIDDKTCRVTQTTCFPKSITELPDFEEKVAPYYIRMDAAIDEDIPALENQQVGLNSPFACQGRFSPHLEANVSSFAKWYATQLLEIKP